MLSMFIDLIVLYLSIEVAVFAINTAIHPDASFSYDGKYYVTVMEERSWDNAEVYCNNLWENGHLVVIKDPIVQALVMKTLGNIVLDMQLTNIWIGLFRNNTRPEQFHWVDGGNLTYQNFYMEQHAFDPYGDEPNNTQAECVNLLVYSDLWGYWNVDDCTKGFFFMCELPAIPCLPGFIKVRDNCYSVIKEYYTWSDAGNYCHYVNQAVGLVSVASPEEQATIESLVADINGSESSKIWIGLQKHPDISSSYIWQYGSVAEYTNFYTKQSVSDPFDNEPNNASHHCINIFNADSRKGYWNDDECEARFYFICEGPAIPSLEGISSSVIETRGNTVTLRCNLRSKRTDYYIVWNKWMDEFDNFQPLITNAFISFPDPLTMVISSSDYEDSGNYICSVAMEMGTIYTSLIHVVVGDYPVAVVPDVVNATIGDNVTLNCSITAQPPLTEVNWMRNNVGLEFSYVFTTHNRYGGSTIENPSLTIYSVNMDDQDYYACAPANAVGVSLSNLLSLVIKGGYPIVEVPATINVTYGNDVILKCSVSADPQHTDVVWKKSLNGLQYENILVSPDKYSGSTVETPSLLVQSTDFSDQGFYICIAWNSAGEGRSNSLLLTVLGGYPIIDVPDDASVVYGETVTLNCTIHSSPPHFEVKWQRSTDFSHFIDIDLTLNKYSGSTLDMPSLIINNIDWDDGGYYQCTARNDVGLGQSSPLILTLLDNINIGYPLVEVSNDSSLYSGEMAILYCFVRSSPPHTIVKWQKSTNKSQFIDIDLTLNKYGGSTVQSPHLIINSVGLNDKGYYRCGAKNDVGWGHSSPMFLNVIYSFLNVTVPQEMYKVTYSESIRLQCLVAAVPSPLSVTWQKLINGSYKNITWDQEKYSGSAVQEASLMISSTNWDDGGFYRCTATSSLKENQSTPLKLAVFVMAPTLEVKVVNYKTLVINYWYNKITYYNETQHFILHINGTTRELPVNEQNYSISLAENTVYSLYIKSYTSYGVGSSPIKIVKTLVIPVFSKCIASIKITSLSFDDSLLDTESYGYRSLVMNVTNSVESAMIETPGFVSTEIVTIRSGSVIVDTVITKNQFASFQQIFDALEPAVRTGSIGNLIVDPTYYRFLIGDGGLKITQFFSPTQLIEETPATFICIAEAIGLTGEIIVNWKFNNLVIRPTLTSRWSYKTASINPMMPQFKQFELMNSGLKLRDEGNITCEVYNDKGTLKHSKTIKTRVITKPVVEIFPLTATVRQGGNVTIRCDISSAVQSATLYWVKDGSGLVTSQDESIEVRNKGMTQILTANDIQRSTLYTCVGSNIAGDRNVLCNVTVIRDEDLVTSCPETTDSYGTLWEESVDGVVVIKPCTGGQIGNVSRLCVKGVWEEPDYSKCFRKDLLDLQNQAEDLKQGIGVEEVDKILTDLNNLTAIKRGKLTSGDLTTTSTTLLSVAEHASGRIDTVSTNQLDEFVSSANNALESDNVQGWIQLKGKNEDKIGNLLKAVTTYTEAYTKTEDREFKRAVEKDNLVVEVGKVQNKDIVFPDKTRILAAWIRDLQTVVRLPRSSIKGNQRIGYEGVYYRNISQLFPSFLVTDGKVESFDESLDVNSNIVDFSVVPAQELLDPPLSITFEYLNTDKSRPLCVFWDYNPLDARTGAWSTVGARLQSFSKNSSICEYDHTTNFAILMSPMGSKPTGHESTLNIISAVGIGISLLFLIITVLVYIVFWNHVRSDRAKILIVLCITLIVSYIIFLFGAQRTSSKNACIAVAALLHYFFLVDFFLMLSMAIEIAFQVLYVIPTGVSRTKKFFLLSFGGPLIIVGASMGATQLEGYGNSYYCWLAVDSGLIWAFAGPALLTVTINLVIMVLVMRTMYLSMTSKIGSKKSTKKDIAISGARSICVLAPLFGVTWIFGVLSVNKDLLVFQYLFAILNSLQGFFLFLFHCLLDRKVRESFKKRGKKGTPFTSSYFSQKSPKTSQKDVSIDKNNNDQSKDLNKNNLQMLNNKTDKNNNEPVGYNPFGADPNRLSPRNLFQTRLSPSNNQTGEVFMTAPDIGTF